jgi:hypothetical protein
MELARRTLPVLSHTVATLSCLQGDASSCEQPHRADAICRWAAADKGWCVQQQQQQP